MGRGDLLSIQSSGVVLSSRDLLDDDSPGVEASVSTSQTPFSAYLPLLRTPTNGVPKSCGAQKHLARISSSPRATSLKLA